jgi:hypothetical protein
MKLVRDNPPSRQYQSHSRNLVQLPLLLDFKNQFVIRLVFLQLWLANSGSLELLCQWMKLPWLFYHYLLLLILLITVAALTEA